MRRRILVLITDHFPYGTGEPFLESEIQYYTGFDRVIIFPHETSPHRRDLPGNFSVYEGRETYKGGIRYDWLFGEILSLIYSSRFNTANYSSMMAFYQRAGSQAATIAAGLKKYGVNREDRLVFYSYWMNADSLAAVIAASKFKYAEVISRCHRIDLYEERTGGYLPFRKLLLRQLRLVLPISDNGKRYLVDRHGDRKHNIHICRLGSLCNYKNALPPTKRTTLRIISCSSLITVKRVYLIVEILSGIKNIPIEWTHIGGGPQLYQITKMCQERLPDNITYCLKGQMANADILKQYEKQPYHLFINVSESEGIPVSIMEAMSYGLPVLATAVGGTPEIVLSGKNGYLLPKDFAAEEAASIIRTVYHMSENDYGKMCRCSRRIWEKHYNGDKNYKGFANILLKLAGGK